jgi:hypothetical protein
MKDITQMKNTLLAKDPTYTQEELDGMTPEQVLNAYNDLMDTYKDDPEDWAWRHEHVIANNL